MNYLFLIMVTAILAACGKGGGPPKDAPVPVELVSVESGPLQETLAAVGSLDARRSSHGLAATSTRLLAQSILAMFAETQSG